MRQIPTKPSIGQVIRNKVDARGGKYTALAESTGIPRATLYRKLDGHGSFTLDEIVKISDFLDVTPGALITEAELAVKAAS